MKTLIITFVSIFLIANICYAKTLIKYHKNTGDIIQTNTVDEMPSDEILNDRFKSEITDVLLVDNEVNIATQKVDLNKKKIVNISKTELDNKKKVVEERLAEEKLIQDEIKAQAVKALEDRGVILKYN